MLPNPLFYLWIIYHATGYCKITMSLAEKVIDFAACRLKNLPFSFNREQGRGIAQSAPAFVYPLPIKNQGNARKTRCQLQDQATAPDPTET